MTCSRRLVSICTVDICAPRPMSVPGRTRTTILSLWLEIRLAIVFSPASRHFARACLGFAAQQMCCPRAHLVSTRAVNISCTEYFSSLVISVSEALIWASSVLSCVRLSSERRILAPLGHANLQIATLPGNESLDNHACRYVAREGSGMSMNEMRTNVAAIRALAQPLPSFRQPCISAERDLSLATGGPDLYARYGWDIYLQPG